MSNILALAAAFWLTVSCDMFRQGPDSPESGKRYSDVCLLYTIGYNNLKSSIDGNLRTVYNSPMPMSSSSKVLLHFQHQSRSDSDWSTPTSPQLVRISSDWNGNAVLDTLLTLEPGSFLTDGEVMESILNYIKENFDADSYGIVFSSHGTGWLPLNYYDAPKAPNGIPLTKTFGCEARTEKGATKAYEMDISTMAESIPYKLDYIIFDACLMGCVEVAYELKDRVGVIGFSQTEVLTTGFCYSTLTERLLSGSRPDPLGFCHDYFDYYQNRGYSQYATISFIDCSGMDGLATACRTLFEKYRNGIYSVDRHEVQRFCRRDESKWWLFDLADIMEKSGISDEDRAELKKALDRAVIYAAHTEKFMDDLKIDTNCGFSMFLPSTGTSNLRAYYRNLDWNKATLLLE